jgi:hypothetical protein
VTPVLPGMATTGIAEGFGELVSHVAVWPLAGVGLSQAASADGVRNRHVMPIDSGHNHAGGDGGRVRRIFSSLHVFRGQGALKGAVSPARTQSVVRERRLGNLVESNEILRL